MYWVYDLSAGDDVAVEHQEEEELRRLKAYISVLKDEDERKIDQNEIAKMQTRILELTCKLTDMGLVEDVSGEWWPNNVGEANANAEFGSNLE
jgi:hypothetical protein